MIIVLCIDSTTYTIFSTHIFSAVQNSSSVEILHTNSHTSTQTPGVVVQGL